MRDISNKQSTFRTASAEATLKVSLETLQVIRAGKVPKGDPLPVAKVAAIQAAKNTSQIIPYCHPIPVDWVGCDIELDDAAQNICVRTEVKATYKTGVEMEALTAATVAALTLYDMLKMIDDTLEIVSIRLLKKTGGKSDFKETTTSLRAAVVVMSDSVAQGKAEDRSGKLIQERLIEEGITVTETIVIPDDPTTIEQTLIECADKKKLDMILTTGGTGVGPRDHTPEATAKVIERELPGIAEAMRVFGQSRTPFSMLSRGIAGVRGRTIIVNLPGSPSAVADGMSVLFPAIKHAFKIFEGKRHE